MNKLTAGICCFALAAFFAWLSVSSVASAMSTRAHATTVGAYLLQKNPTSLDGLTTLVIVATVVMLLIGLACVISGLRSKSA
jgi:TRAP-type C4-dicarboxylate transport system permease small subunit